MGMKFFFFFGSKQDYSEFAHTRAIDDDQRT